MSATCLRPRSATEIVDAAFQLLRAHYGAFAAATAVVLLPTFVLQLVLPASVATIVAVVEQILLIVVDGVIVALVAQAYLGEPVDVGAALRSLGGRIGTLLGGAIMRGLLAGIATLLLVVPGIIVWVWTFAVSMVIVIEGAGVGTALSRSRELARGGFGRIFGALILAFLLVMLMLAAVTVAVGMLLGAIGVGDAVTQATATVLLVLVYPFFAIVGTLLYYDARIRREGFDVEMMARELGGAGGTVAPTTPAAPIRLR
ncbi:MAG TPA: hypothetical protein VFY16_03835 [Gemmatimonadaceae bacterium]|nr:hypothetical protein [Gemmatimonadaceae bacterium]